MADPPPEPRGPKPRGGALPVADLLRLERGAPQPLARQLTRQLRSAILHGRLAPGARLPGSRSLAEAVGVSRTTVLDALEQLHLEGYLSTRPGAGTFVAPELPAAIQPTAAAAGGTPPPPRLSRPPRLSQRGEALAATTLAARQRHPAPVPLQPGLPDLDAFPYARWRRTAREAVRALPRAALGYAPVAGFAPLRAAVARYLGAARGVAVDAERVIVTSGTQQSAALAALALLDPGDGVGLEEPGYSSGRDAFLGLGAVAVPIPVDPDGADPAALAGHHAPPRLVALTPSHQYPTGALLPLERRLRWLEWAERVDARIFEDDYDSEFRYDARPVAAMQGLTPAGRTRVLYAGTFSKTLAPGLRLGYLVAPPDLVAPLEAAKGAVDRGAPTLPQATLARFLDDGHYVRYLAARRRDYAERRAALRTALRATLPPEAEILPSAAGLQLALRLPPRIDDVALAAALRADGFGPGPLSRAALGGGWSGLLVGFASADVATLERGADAIAARVRELL